MLLKKLGCICLSVGILSPIISTNSENIVFAANENNTVLSNDFINVNNFIRKEGNVVYVNNSYFYSKLKEGFDLGFISKEDYLNLKSSFEDRWGPRGETKIEVVPTSMGIGLDIYLNNYLSAALVGGSVAAVAYVMAPIAASVAASVGLSATSFSSSVLIGAFGAAVGALSDPGDGLILTVQGGMLLGIREQ